MSGLGNGKSPSAGKRRSKLAVGGTRIVAGYGRASTRPGRARLIRPPICAFKASPPHSAAAPAGREAETTSIRTRIRVFYDGSDQPVKITEPSPAKLRQPLLELLAGRDDIDEDFPEIDDPPPEPIDPFERWSEADADQGGERVLLLPAERIALLRDVSHLPRRKTPLPDEAFARESFYSKENPAHAVVFRAKR